MYNVDFNNRSVSTMFTYVPLRFSLLVYFIFRCTTHFKLHVHSSCNGTRHVVNYNSLLQYCLRISGNIKFHLPADITSKQSKRIGIAMHSAATVADAAVQMIRSGMTTISKY
ncbi:hypothetical protein T12_5065 [Trichinella patagoniensis]|uniref:Uncharacterized protein n=1 Tax=Trichinella patagoniensis TaxID=990121 RepID=A0A0V0ZVM1_9BILA|nr:hypothetical protein T12_5065 [Trichinella patagoniensis]